ncbi:protein of unknown function [Kyrpidia spormannii]|uniref:Uncharacterized protein n=1 Tax=Kyrpidia spormannii TaxID=2055160 RepID=A0ACA8Z4G5_9BACL|nr:protein of unknown function [Kyrpidia spormannii]
MPFSQTKKPLTGYALLMLVAEEGFEPPTLRV